MPTIGPGDVPDVDIQFQPNQVISEEDAAQLVTAQDQTNFSAFGRSSVVRRMNRAPILQDFSQWEALIAAGIGAGASIGAAAISASMMPKPVASKGDTIILNQAPAVPLATDPASIVAPISKALGTTDEQSYWVVGGLVIAAMIFFMKESK